MALRLSWRAARRKLSESACSRSQPIMSVAASSTSAVPSLLRCGGSHMCTLASAACSTLPRPFEYSAASTRNVRTASRTRRMAGWSQAAPLSGQVQGPGAVVCGDATRVGGTRGLRSARVALRKKLGQHLLKHPEIVDKIVAAARITDTDHVMEIGPGSGNLTVPLLQAAGHVTAYELDRSLHRTVKARVEELGLSNKFSLHQGDFLSHDLPPFDMCVANIPFQISSPVLDKLVTHRPLIKRAVIMFQAEFAERLTAKPGSKHYSRLSVNTQLIAAVRHVLFIPRAHFRPPPKVDCIVAEIVPREPPPGIDMEGFVALTRMCFMAKNKTLRAVLRLNHCVTMLAYGLAPPKQAQARLLRGADETGAEERVRGIIDEVLHVLGVESERANGLSVEQFRRLYFALEEAGIDLAKVGAAQTSQPASRTAAIRRQARLAAASSGDDGRRDSGKSGSPSHLQLIDLLRE